MRIITVLGTRPQIMKAASLCRLILNNFQNIEEIIVHSGQHYDKNMSDVFFKELEIPKSQINLKVDSSYHGAQTALMIEKIEKVVQEYLPYAVVVQKEAFFFKKSCVILRHQTKWIEIVRTKSAVISDTNPKIVLEATERLSSNLDLELPKVFGNGKAASFIAQEMLDQFS